MHVSLIDRIPFLRILIGLVISCFVAAGLVLLAGQLPCPAGPCQNEKFSMGYVGDVGALGLLLSAAALVATIALWVCVAVISSVNRKGAEPQGLLKLDDRENNARHWPTKFSTN